MLPTLADLRFQANRGLHGLSGLGFRITWAFLGFRV